jgi:hypothetical protein
MGPKTPNLPEEEIFPEPSVVETLAGRRRIGEMTADEYLKLVRDAQNQLEKPANSHGSQRHTDRKRG